MIVKEYQINTVVNCDGAQAASGSRWCVEQVVYNDDNMVLTVNVYKDNTHADVCKQTDIPISSFTIPAVITTDPKAASKTLMDAVLAAQYPANVVEIS